MKLEVGKTYLVKVVDGTSCNVLGEYTKAEMFIRKFGPNTIAVGRVLLFALSICIPPLLLITIPLMKKYPQASTKGTSFGVRSKA